MKSELNSRIKKYRKLADLTQEDVAKSLNMKLSTYSQMERGGKIKAEYIEPIAKILNVDPIVLLFGEQNDNDITLPPIAPTPERDLRQPPPPPIFMDETETVLPLKNREIQAIKIIRALSPEQREETYKYIHNKHLEKK